MELNANFDDEDMDDEMYEYQLIQFVTDGPNTQQVAMVPSLWPHCNAQTGTMETQFLPPPYSEEMVEILKEFVKEKLPPLKKWPIYTVKLVGRAKTYEDGISKLSLLKKRFEEDSTENKETEILTSNYEDDQYSSNCDTNLPNKHENQNKLVQQFEIGEKLAVANNSKNVFNVASFREIHPDPRNNENKEKQKEEKRDESKTVSSDMQLLLDAMKGITLKQDEILNRLTSSTKDFISDNNLELPFRELSTFDEFNEKLKDDQFKHEFVLSLHTLMAKEFNVSKSVRNIINKYMSKDLAVKFTHQKKSGEKSVLKNYIIHQCILDAVTQTHAVKEGEIFNDLEETAFKAIGKALSGAKK